MRILYYLSLVAGLILLNIVAQAEPKGESVETVAQLRGRLLRAYQANNEKEIKEKTDSAAAIYHSSDYFALYPIEEWLLYYQTSQWQKLDSSVMRYDSVFATQIAKKKQPLKDELFVAIQKSSLANYASIGKIIVKSNLSIEDKHFFALLFASCMMGVGSKTITQDSLNIRSDEFLTKFQDSRWAWYTKTYIRNEYSVGNWGIDFEVFAGMGSVLVSNDEKFNTHIPLGFGMSVYYKRAMLQLRNYIGQTSVRKEIPMSSTTWERGSAASVYKIEALLGVVAFESVRLRIVPVAGVSSFDIMPSDAEITRNANYKGMAFNFFPVYVFGTNVELKFARKPKLSAARSEHGFWFLRCRAAYETTYSQTPQLQSYSFTLSLGGFARKIDRKY